MLDFLKKNKLLTVCVGVSIVICVIYVFSLDETELFPHAKDWFGLLFQISIGFIINFIFYVTQIYIPHYKQNKEAKRCISLRIENVVRYMRELLSYLGEKYMGYYKEEDVTDEYFLCLLKKISLHDRIRVLHVRRVNAPSIGEESYFTVKEWMLSRIEYTESEIDKIMKYYVPYINIELMTTLEDILKSVMHNSMAHILLQIPNGVSFKDNNEDIYLKPYFDLMKKLEIVGMHYNK